MDCLIDEFWNGHDDEDNSAIEQFLLDGGGLIMGGHAWYWSYSNSDVPHNYPGNKISQTTGLMVSSNWGYNDIDFDIPDGIKIVVEKQTTLKITGSDKQKVGSVASKLKTLRKIEPYKGKGVREKGQYVLKKEGKKK